MIELHKLNMSQLRLDNNIFKNIFSETFKYCIENEVLIPEVKKRKISTRID